MNAKVIAAAKTDMDRDGDYATFSRLKADRDGLARAIGAGEIWGEPTAH